ncbi:hypothetical protein LV75_001830 [Actinokineospora diospyrosa]|uniref:Uncharacterized protein n=1 Tax=Actinokineospora diospyrosa TaxID=103728 RepID=A0ABT1I9N8_9PSEU|nr:hypothetical protein [Actinokineospora diospyrosa]
MAAWVRGTNRSRGSASPLKGLLVAWRQPRGPSGVVRWARWGGLPLRGAPTTPVAGPQSRGRKDWPCREETLRVSSPRAKEVRPIEQLAGRLPTRPVQDHLPQEPPIYSLLTDPDRTGAAITACGQQNTLWTTTRHPAQARTLDVRSRGATSSPVRSAPTHPLSAWTLGTAGAIPARPRQPCQPTWTVGVAGANCSMGRTCFAWGDNTRSVASQQGHAFRPLLCGSATGVVGAPRKTSWPHRADRIAADRARCCRQATRRPLRHAELAARRRGRPQGLPHPSTQQGRAGGPAASHPARRTRSPHGVTARSACSSHCPSCRRRWL